jgi:hypothetical protein
MVIQFHFTLPRRQAAFLTAEIMIAIALLSAALLTLSYSFNQERHIARSSYYQAIAMEIVDGEMEVLLAGEWRSFTEGAHEYTVHASAVTNLPPGQFTLTRQARTLRLEWVPTKQGSGGGIMREARVK